MPLCLDAATSRVQAAGALGPGAPAATRSARSRAAGWTRDHALSALAVAVIAGVAVAACVALCVGVPASASASEFHSQDFRFGQRAMAMGGAVVGAVTGPTASYYNPAGLAFLKGTLFAGALQYYGLDKRTITGALRDDQIGTKTLESDSFLATPTSSVLSHAFAGGRHRVAYSTYLVTNVNERFSGGLAREDADDQLLYKRTVKASWRQRDQVLYLGPSYAYQASERLAVGVSVFYVRREQTVDRTADEQIDEHEVATGLFYQSIFYDDATSSALVDGALLARIGVMWRPTDALSLGVTVRTRSLNLHGEGTESIKYAYSGNPDAQEAPDRNAFSDPVLDVQTVYPWSVSAGAAWRVTPALLLAVSGEVDLAVRYRRYALGVFSEPATTAVHDVNRQLNWNVSVGAELLVSPRVPLRVGWFTNRSAAPEIQAVQSQAAAARVHQMGVTCSGGYLGAARSFNVGVEYAWGTGHDAVLAQSALPLSDFVRVERRQQRLILFLSGAISFAKATAKEVIREKVLGQPK